MFHNRNIPQCESKKKFPLLSLVSYLFNVVSNNRYLTRGNNENVLNVFVSRQVLPLVIRTFLDCVMIH